MPFVVLTATVLFPVGLARLFGAAFFILAALASAMHYIDERKEPGDNYSGSDIRKQGRLFFRLFVV